MSNNKVQSPNQCQRPNDKKFDLEERTALFGEEIIVLAKGIAQSPVNNPLISQIVKSGTSVGANYMEADGAESKRDFKHKISICKKESKETKHLLRMIAKANPEKKEECRRLWNEAQELSLIFSAIVRKK